MIVDYVKDDVYQHQNYVGVDFVNQFSGSAGVLTTAFGSYKIQVDWDKDSSWNGVYDNITADVKNVSYTRGKDEELGKANPGTLQLTVNNSDNKYSPSYSSSPLYGILLPKRPIRVVETTTGLSLFYGFIENIIQFRKQFFRKTHFYYPL